MNGRPYTDLHKIAKEEVIAHMKPFIEVTMREHEETRREIKGAVKIMKMASVNRINIILLWALDAVILGILIILLV